MIVGYKGDGEMNPLPLLLPKFCSCFPAVPAVNSFICSDNVHTGYLISIDPMQTRLLD